MITPKLIRLLSACKYIDSQNKELHREDRMYKCNIDNTILSFHGVTIHYRNRHADVYQSMLKMIQQRIVLPENSIICQCGGHYIKSGKKQHELTQIHQKWLLQAQQTLSMQT